MFRIEFFLNSPSHIVLSSVNQPHFFTSFDSYLQLFAASNETKGNPNGVFAKQTEQYIIELLEKKLPALYKKIEQEILDGNDTNRGRKSLDLLSLKDYIEALSAEYGFGNPELPVGNNSPDIDFNQLIQEQLKQDSVNQ
jgi:molybdopterin converting factor small subunit